MIKNVEDLSAEDLAKMIQEGKTTLEELRATGDLDASKRKQIVKILEPKQEPKPESKPEPEPKSDELKPEPEAARKEEDISKITPVEAKKKFGEKVLRELCKKIDIDYDIVDKYSEPSLDFNDFVPKTQSEIPSGHTDVFFWGAPSSGKSCALSAILNTINEQYTMDAPILPSGISESACYLPPPTAPDRMQYISFRLKRRGANELYRNISFFELSGEISSANASKTIGLLLKSNNRKIHFFFIDYSQALQNKQEQAKYLNAAVAYFRDKSNLFEKKTDAVYVIVTKADEIEAESDEEKSKLAGIFLEKNYGSFIDILNKCCKDNSVFFKKRIFSIGKVYFSKICKINRKHSIHIIEDLLTIVEPPPSEYKWHSKIFRFFSS